MKISDDPKIYLGIDWGESKIGLAIADEENRIALAFKTVKKDDKILSKIKEIIEKENIAEIVIGRPFYLRNEKIPSGGEKFGELIEKRIGLPIHYQNEMFTTRMAQKNLIETGAKDVGKIDDKESARIILQDWLDR
ncbi:MAG: Holliday junction resolvase RuvX [Candidatus Moranbacteria bacterium]|jgi:putative Holliday junction resolvase|nr:Holliday junction resolvase RuvX [Candidatus Moranbacteria bacterium]MDX9855701.1 Holliday junction resolvase RuvX [Candidatus Moranbacteria bacterium]